MFKKLFNNWSPKSHSNVLKASSFNHCSSVCAHKYGVLIAWYSGSGECKDDQSVYVVFESSGAVSEPLCIGPKTGNPVLIPQSRSKAVLVWSKFEDTGPITRIVDRWKHCSLWAAYIYMSDGKVKLDGCQEKIAEPNKHLLGRCNPIRVGGHFLLPLYDEVHAHGVIYKGNGLEYKPLGRLGTNMIQPTLWTEGKRIYSLSRNFMTQKHFRARQCHSDDGGVTWSEPVPCRIPNNNSSLHVVEWNKHILVMWNNTPLPKRDSMTLGTITTGADKWYVNIVHTLSSHGVSYGAYPSMCVDHIGNLHMTYSSIAHTIEHNVWNYKYFKLPTYMDKPHL